MEEKMWAGSYYLLYNEPKTGKKSDLVFGYQLDGQWMVKFHGLPGIFRADRVKATLETIKRLNASITKFGASDVVTPQGNLAEGIGYGINTFFVPEVDILGATYMYEGQREFRTRTDSALPVCLERRMGIYLGSAQCHSRRFWTEDSRNISGSKHVVVDCASRRGRKGPGRLLRSGRLRRSHPPGSQEILSRRGMVFALLTGCGHALVVGSLDWRVFCGNRGLVSLGMWDSTLISTPSTIERATVQSWLPVQPNRLSGTIIVG